MILIQQNGQASGPYTAAQVKELLLFQRIKPGKALFAWPGAAQWFSHAEFKPFLELMADDDVIVYGGKDLILTMDRILLKTQVFKKDEIDEFVVVIPEPFHDPREEMMRRIGWWAAIILCWTVIVPIAVWIINKKSPKEEGLGEVYGIRITGSFGSEIIKDGMGLLPPDDPKRSMLAEMYQILKDWKAGKLSAPSLASA